MNQQTQADASATIDLQKYFRSANFIQSAAGLTDCPALAGPEIAFAGRSNAGKSSAINRITDNKKLAKTSKTPGRTQLINFFELNDGARLVDLPGYGFAKVSKEKKNTCRNICSTIWKSGKPLPGWCSLWTADTLYSPSIK